jgi:manganese/zinc/iron transport system substrate-binding protein
MKQSILLILALFVFSACSGPAVSEKPLVVCTTGMIADGVQQLLGDKAEVVALMGPGVDPHLYKATQGDLGRLRKATGIVYNGLYLEGKMEEILEKLGRQKPVYAVGTSIPIEALLMDPDNPTVPDPHIWFDLALWEIGMQGVASFLISVFPDWSEDIKSNAALLSADLLTLDRQVKADVNDIPESRRILITAHDAFQYFGRAYGIEVESLQGISTASEYGLQDITRIVNLIVERRIPAVFIESSVSPRAINAVVSGCGKLGHEVQIGGALYSDALGAADSEAASFSGAVLHNIKTIVAGLNPKDL